MKINNFISLVGEDITLLQQEIAAIHAAFLAMATSPREEEQYRALFAKEYPALTQLRAMAEFMIAAQQSKDPPRQAVITKFRVITNKEIPDEPA